MDSAWFRRRASFGSELQDWRCPKVARTEKMMMVVPSTTTTATTTRKSPPSPSFSSSCSPSSSHPVLNDGQAMMLSFSSPKMGPSGFSCHYPSSQTVSTASAANIEGMATMGPFTPAQWMELEHQALIYRCMHANVPIPSGLLFAIVRSIGPSARNADHHPPAGSLEASSYGCGPMQSGVSGGGGGTDLEPGRCRRTDGKKWRCSRDAMADQKYCERHMNRGRHRSRKPVEAAAELALPLTSPRAAPRVVAAARYPPHKDGNRTKSYHNYLNTESNSTDPLAWLNPSADSGLLAPANSHSNLPSTYQGSQPPTLRGFLDVWPRDQARVAPSTWPAARETHLDETPPPQLKLSCRDSEDTAHDDPRKEPWVGGPLGEMLNSTTSNNKARGSTRDLSDLNLTTDGWGSSPTAVLQKGDMGSVSSSTRSSPRNENRGEPGEQWWLVRGGALRVDGCGF